MYELISTKYKYLSPVQLNLTDISPREFIWIKLTKVSVALSLSLTVYLV